MLARELLNDNLIKLEVLADKNTLLPNEKETLIAAKELVGLGFSVMVYTTDNVLLANELETIGCAAVMPLASPIGTGQGIINADNIKKIIKNAKIPIIIDAGIGTASDATIAMEMGCDAVLLNSAIAMSKNPILMAKAMKHAVIAGRNAYEAKRMKLSSIAIPSSNKKNALS
jgi:thiazole synthase